MNEFEKMEKKIQIYIDLKPYTRERCHELYKIYKPDPLMTYDAYAYDQAKMDRYYDSKVMDDSRRFFAIVHENMTIGEIQLKYIDYVNGHGILSIIIANDDYKNCGAGTAAINRMLLYAKESLKLRRVFADAIHRNTRSQNVLERIGFKFMREDEDLRYYEYCLMGDVRENENT